MPELQRKGKRVGLHSTVFRKVGLQIQVLPTACTGKSLANCESQASGFERPVLPGRTSEVRKKPSFSPRVRLPALAVEVVLDSRKGASRTTKVFQYPGCSAAQKWNAFSASQSGAGRDSLDTPRSSV